MEKALDTLGRVLMKSAPSVELLARDFGYELAEAVNTVWIGWNTEARLRERMKALLTRYLRESYIAGLEAGGYDEEDMGQLDRQLIREYTRKQHSAVAGFAAAVALSRTGNRNGIRNRMEMWVMSVKSLGDTAYMTTDGKRLLRFVLMPGRKPSEESCTTCSRLLGRTMRARDILKQGLLVAPGNKHYECGGWRCPHGWVAA
jgi:hypothetical protein